MEGTAFRETEGEKIWVLLPAFVVIKIRKTFPDGLGFHNESWRSDIRLNRVLSLIILLCALESN